MERLGDIVDAGIDYLSMTMKIDNPNVQQWLLSANNYLQEIAVHNDEINHTRRLGYEGLSFGGSFVGRRERDAFCSFSGERAKRAHTLLYRHDIHVARIDVQVSFRYAVSTADIAQRAREEVKKDNARLSSARQRNATLMEDLRGGATCYVGGKKSEQFARLYNKEAESGDSTYKNVWRFEVQLKNRLAEKVAKQFSENDYPPPEYAAVFVKQWLRHRGVSTPWTASAELVPLPVDRTAATQSEARLKWLREQVRPAIRQLLKYGLRDDIIDALGLDDPATRNE
jgi:Replication initiation factor